MEKQRIRVVVFGGGPVIEYGIKKFITLLEDHPEMDFLCAICQSKHQTLVAVIRDLWKRRKLLAVPLLILSVLKWTRRYLIRPVDEYRLNRKLSQLAERIYFVPDIHAADVLTRVQSLSPDLGLIYGAPILKPELFEIPRMGTLGIHHGKVPEYRGKKTTFWAMYNGETYVGATIQKINAGLDTGEIVKHGEVPVGRHTYGSVWRQLESLSFNLYIQAILEVKNGTAVYRPQLGKKGRLYKDPQPNEIAIFWWRQLKRILNFSSSQV
jgi:methionyl-tRNA formyltransferase